MLELPITLPSLAIEVMKILERMSRLDYAALLNTIKAWKPAVEVETGKSTESEQEPDK